MNVAVERSRPASRARFTVWKAVRKNWAAYVFISPFYMLFSIFGLFSLVFSLYVSFHRWDGLTPMRWWGIKNYVELFQDEVFFTAVKNTFLLLLFDFPLKVVTPLILAILLNNRLVKFRGFFSHGVLSPRSYLGRGGGNRLQLLFQPGYGHCKLYPLKVRCA